MKPSQARKQNLKIQRYSAVTRCLFGELKLNDTRVLPERAQRAPSCGVCGTQFSHDHARALCLNAHQTTWCHGCQGHLCHQHTVLRAELTAEQLRSFT